MRRKGFSLLEVLIALIIITAGTLAIIQAFSSGLLASGDVENVDLALNIAQAKMEQIKDTSFASLADSAPIADLNFPDFTVALNVAEGQDPMRAEVTVAWNVKGGQANVTLTSLLTNY